MVHPKIVTLANQFKLHELKFQNASSYLASKLDSDQNPARLRQNLAQLQTIASRLEELAEQMSAHMPLEELEPFLQISADSSLEILQIIDQSENLTTTELTHAHHSQSSPAFTAVQLRCDEFTTRRPRTSGIFSAPNLFKKDYWTTNLFLVDSFQHSNLRSLSKI